MCVREAFIWKYRLFRSFEYLLLVIAPLAPKSHFFIQFLHSIGMYNSMPPPSPPCDVLASCTYNTSPFWPFLPFLHFFWPMEQFPQCNGECKGWLGGQPLGPIKPPPTKREHKQHVLCSSQPIPPSYPLPLILSLLLKIQASHLAVAVLGSLSHALRVRSHQLSLLALTGLRLDLLGWLPLLHKLGHGLLLHSGLFLVQLSDRFTAP